MKRRKNRTVQIKVGHRESRKQHEASDAANLQMHELGYRKGTCHSGGGGRIGSGGKKGRPLGGWEKGDVVRDENIASTPFPLRIKSAKRLRSKKAG